MPFQRLMGSDHEAIDDNKSIYDQAFFNLILHHSHFSDKLRWTRDAMQKKRLQKKMSEAGMKKIEYYYRLWFMTIRLLQLWIVWLDHTHVCFQFFTSALIVAVILQIHFGPLSKLPMPKLNTNNAQETNERTTMEANLLKPEINIRKFLNNYFSNCSLQQWGLNRSRHLKIFDR